MTYYAIFMCMVLLKHVLFLMLFIFPTEDEECVPSRDVSRHFEDPSYGYQDFSRRGEHVPTFRVQVNQQGTNGHPVNIRFSQIIICISVMRWKVD